MILAAHIAHARGEVYAEAAAHGERIAVFKPEGISGPVPQGAARLPGKVAAAVRPGSRR